MKHDLTQVTWIRKSPGMFDSPGLVIILHARLRAVPAGPIGRDPKTGAHRSGHEWVCETRDWGAKTWDVIQVVADINKARRWLFQSAGT